MKISPRQDPSKDISVSHIVVRMKIYVEFNKRSNYNEDNFTLSSDCNAQLRTLEELIVHKP
jgi:hypothetical protein